MPLIVASESVMLRTRVIWHSMKMRCTSKHPRIRKSYADRGIAVCPQWASSFTQFVSDVGFQPPGRILDRIDVNGGYEPGNVRWVTAKQSMRNRTYQHMLTFKGKTKTMAEWADEYGIRYGTLNMRVNTRGWSIKKSLTTPTMTPTQRVAITNRKRYGHA